MLNTLHSPHLNRTIPLPNVFVSMSEVSFAEREHPLCSQDIVIICARSVSGLQDRDRPLCAHVLDNDNDKNW